MLSLFAFFSTIPYYLSVLILKGSKKISVTKEVTGSALCLSPFEAGGQGAKKEE
jgi:hypothetical protein